MTNSAQCVFDGGDCLGWYFILDGLYMMMRLEGKFTYYEAKIACENLGAKIFEPIFLNHTEEIKPFFDNDNGQGIFWTGINDVVEEGKYVEDKQYIHIYDPYLPLGAHTLFVPHIVYDPL